MSGRQKQRTKGNVQPASSGRTAELMTRESGGATGFIGFGTMSGDLGYVPQDDLGSGLDADFRMLLRKLTKKDVVTKLKALQEFGVLCKDKDTEAVSATLPHWCRLYGRLAIDHDKRVREATQQTFVQLVERVKRNLAPHLRSIMGPWLLSQCDTYPGARNSARAAFLAAFPTNKQQDAIGYCNMQIIQYLQGNLFKETPTTLSDASTTTAAEQEEKYLRVITSSLLALEQLVSMVTEKDKTIVCEQMAAILSDGKLWKMAKHKTPMVRSALFTLLGSVCSHMPTVADSHIARISPTLLGNLDEIESSAAPELWKAVLYLVSQLPDCWTHVNPRKAVLPKLWSLLRSGGQGCASVIYPSLLPLLSKIPPDVIGNGVAFYQELFNHFKTGLSSDSVSKMASETEAVVKAYTECLRYVISRNLTIEEDGVKIHTLLIEDHLLVLLESSIIEKKSKLSSTSLYSQTAMLISYLQKQTVNQPTADQSASSSKAADHILKMLWDNVTKLCLSQLKVEPVAETSQVALERITTLLRTFIHPKKSTDMLQKGKQSDVKVKFALSAVGDDNAEQEGDAQMGQQRSEVQEGSDDAAEGRTSFETKKGEEQNSRERSASCDLANISAELRKLACQVVNLCLSSATTHRSQPHLKLLSNTVSIFPILDVYNEILNVNSSLKGSEATIPSTEHETGMTMYDNIHEAAIACFHTVFLPWLVDLDSSDDIIRERTLDKNVDFLVDMVYVVLCSTEDEHRAAILNEICTDTGSPVVLHKLVKKIQSQSDSGFLLRWLKSPKFGEKIVSIADSLCHMTMDSQSVIRKRSWDLISLGLSTNEHGEPKMDTVYAEKVLLKFTEALQTSKVEGQRVDQAHNAVSFICDVASHFFSGVEGCMLIKSTENLLFALFEMGCSDSTTLSDSLRDKINAAWETGVKVLVAQTGGLLSDEGFLYKVTSWIKDSLLTSTHTLQWCDHLAQAAHTLCMTVMSSLTMHDSEPSNSIHIIEQLLSLILPTDEEWNSHNAQLTTQWQISVLLDNTLTYPGALPTIDDDASVEDTMPTSAITTVFIASLLRFGDSAEDQLSWRYSFMESAILEMAHTLHWCKGMMGLKASNKLDMCLPPESHVPEYCQRVAVSLKTTLNQVLSNLNPEEWQALLGKAIHRSLCEGGLWSLSLGGLLAAYDDCCTSSSTSKCNIYDMIGGPDRLTDMTETSIHTLESAITYLGADQILEIIQISTAVMITSEPSSIPNINGGLGLLAILTRCLQYPDWQRITRYNDLIVSCVEQLISWRDQWEQGFLFNCNLSEADSELFPVNIKLIGFLQEVVDKIPTSLSSHHWDFVLCSLVSWIQSCTEDLKALTSDSSIAALCCAVCDLLTSATNLLSNSNQSNLPSNLATEWKEFFSEAAFTVLLPVLMTLVEDTDFSQLSITQHHLLRSLCQAVSLTPEEHLYENKLEEKLHPDSWLPDNLQTLTNTLCPMLNKPLRCVQLAAYQMLTRVMPSVTKHDEEHLQIGSIDKDEEDIILTPPPALKVLLDSSAVLMETLLGDVLIGECVTMEPGSEAYHDTLVYLLCWRLNLAVFKAASPEVRASYATYMRDAKLVEHLLENLFCLMPKSPILGESSKESSKDAESSRESNGKSSSTKSKSTQSSMLTDEPQLKIKDGVPSSLEIQHQACAVYLSSLEELPAMVRQWWNGQDKRVVPLVEKFTAKYVSPVLCSREFQDVQCQPAVFDNMTVKARPVTWEVIATYTMEELSMDLVIQLATNHPLGAITVDSARKVGVSQSQWRNWMLQLTTFLTHQNGSILDGLKLWKRNVDKRFEGVDDCMICFSVIHGSNYSLPKLQCKTCKKRFHSACLYKWFNTSNQSSCPLCRSPF